MSKAVSEQASMDAAVRYLLSKYSPKGKWVGWLMMASILVEAWDLYAIAFVLVFIREQYHPDPLLLGLAAAGTQGGAVIGALLGGWLSDKLGRRVMFLSTMYMFIIFALLQAVVPNLGWLVVVRFILGIPLGSDISTGYTYIMESMPKGDREVMGNRWQFMFAVGEVLTLAVIALFIVSRMPSEWIWRLTLALGTVPAALILFLRHDLPETAVWLIRHGRFREAKQVAMQMYCDRLEMLPDNDVTVPKPRLTAFLADLRKDPIRWRGWALACAISRLASPGLNWVQFCDFILPMALQRVCFKSELAPGGVKRLDAPPIAVFNVEGSYFAISDVCTHEWARLSDGEVDGETVICPLHGACFSLSTGEALSLPAIEPVETFAVILQGDDIYVEL